MGKKLRIAMVFSSNPAKAGGVQEHLYYLSAHLRKRGHKVTIFGPKPDKSHRYLNYRSLGYVVDTPKLNGDWSYVHLPRSQDKKIFQKLKPGNFDLCHIEEPHVPLLAWQIINDIKIPKVAVFHTAWDKDSVLNIINPLLTLLRDPFSSLIHGVLYVSQITRKAWKNLSRKKVLQAIIPNGIDFDLFVPKNSDKTDEIINLLFVARIVKTKGLKHLLKSIKHLKKQFPNIRLVVLGSGPDLQGCINYATNHGLSSIVSFQGQVVGQKKIAYFQNADIFCAPYSADEAFGITMIEAMACGCPVVGFKNEATKQIFKNYPDTRLFVKQKDTVSLANAIKKLILDKKLRSKIRRWSIEESQKYHWEKIAQKTEAFYYQVLDRFQNQYT